MTNKEAIDILAAFTEPQNAGRFIRLDYWRAQEALKLISEALLKPEKTE